MQIRGHELTVPILQGGMGVGVSMGGLAGAVAACGGMGTISTADVGFQEPDFDRDPLTANLRALKAKRPGSWPAGPAWWRSTPWWPPGSLPTRCKPP